MIFGMNAPIVWNLRSFGLKRFKSLISDVGLFGVFKSRPKLETSLAGRPQGRQAGSKRRYCEKSREMVRVQASDLVALAPSLSHNIHTPECFIAQLLHCGKTSQCNHFFCQSAVLHLLMLWFFKNFFHFVRWRLVKFQSNTSSTWRILPYIFTDFLCDF